MATNMTDSEPNRKFQILTVIIFMTLALMLIAGEMENDHLSAYFNPQEIRPPFATTPQCSLEVFKKYIANNNFFPDRGRWSIVGNGTRLYEPDLCTFQWKISPTYIRQCLKDRKYTKILLLGDSNGRRYFDAFRRLLTQEGAGRYVCKKVKEEARKTKMPDVSYFLKGTGIKAADVVSHSRDCFTCNSMKVNCHGLGKAQQPRLTLEIVTMEHLVDTEITTVRSVLPCSYANVSINNCSYSNTYQEFIFQEYLKNDYPDFILFFANSHDTRKKDAIKIKADMEYLMRILQYSIPNTTKVLWMSVNGHYSDKLKYLHWDNLRSMNHALFEVLKPIISKDNSNVYGFLDLQSMSREILPIWKDKAGMAGHLQSPWYSRVVSNVIQTICS